MKDIRQRKSEKNKKITKKEYKTRKGKRKM